MMACMTPKEELARLTQAITAATTARDEAIVRHLLDQVPPADIARATGLSDERIRQIARAAGVPPRKSGRPKRT